MIIKDHIILNNVEGFLNKAKKYFKIGDNLVIRRVDVNDVEKLFSEKLYSYVRLGNIDTYVGELSDGFYEVLSEKYTGKHDVYKK